MKKALKIIGKVLLGVLIAVVVALLIVFIYHRIQLSNEKELFSNPPLGQLVEVDGKKMNVYTEGKGDKTLVFLPGAFTTSPILDFKEFTDKIKDDYKIVIIEKFGYGFSDISDDDRTTDTMTRQNREALAKAGIEGPYILCPHSFSGLEAIYWAQHYSDEVEAIISLDMAVPRCYDGEEYSEKSLDSAVSGMKIFSVFREMGLVRLFITDGSLPEYLNENEKDYIRAIASRGNKNESWQSEVKHIRDDIKMLDAEPIPDVPTLMFVSDGSGTTGESWIGFEKDYASKLTDVKLIELNCKHAVYHEKPEEIIKNMKDFISTLDS